MCLCTRTRNRVAGKPAMRTNQPCAKGFLRFLDSCVFAAQGIETIFFNEDIMEIFKNRYRREAVEVVCPICKHSQIVYFPEEEMPRCPKCKKKMIVKEVLTEGKY